MKLKKLIKIIDSLIDVVIWGDDDEQPLYKGSLFEVPWYIAELKIGRKDKDKNADEPIYIAAEEKTHRPIMVINVIE